MATQTVFSFSNDRELQEEFANLTERSETIRNKLFQLTNTAITEFIEKSENDVNVIADGAQEKEESVTKELEECQVRLAQIEKKSEEVEDLKTRVNIGAKETDALLREKEQLEINLKTQENEIEKEGELMAAQSSSDQKEHLEASAKFFKDRLGLQFKKISGGRLQVVFTCIDSREPDRPFVFCIKIDEKVYTVTDVEPPVPNLQELVTDLNRTNNIQRFVRSMRIAFKDSL